MANTSNNNNNNSKNSNMENSKIKKVVVVGATHGNEYTGAWVIQSIQRQQRRRQQQKEGDDQTTIQSKYPSLEVSTLLGNPRAHSENRRFVDEDLNRQFALDTLQRHAQQPPHTLSYEAKRSLELNHLLGPKSSSDDEHPSADLLVDLHTTTTNMGVTLIIGERDVLPARAVAYAMATCPFAVRCLLHTHKTKHQRPNLGSVARHGGITIEIGPIPNGVVRHDVVEQMERTLEKILEFCELHNNHQHSDPPPVLLQSFPDAQVPCFCSAPAQRPGEMSGKLVWPTQETDPQSNPNPNFPQWIVHKSLQDQDFGILRTGDPLFVDLDGNTIPYSGSHGSPVHILFVNEAGYYYKSSGTGISVANPAKFDLWTGELIRTTSK